MWHFNKGILKFPPVFFGPQRKQEPLSFKITHKEYKQHILSSIQRQGRGGGDSRGEDLGWV